ncbi:MAG: tetratricopeptide repeat protein, partial [Candidatus Poribacteria bacterium]|nr:tetratricopeptide repeat protein [Candidatus Poribacteria bacterium]
MFGHIKQPLRLFKGFFCLMLLLLAAASAEISKVRDERIVERYKLMLERKPKEGNTFDRLCQLYLEGAGLEQMIADFEAEIETDPDNANLRLILGHIFKRFGKDEKAIAAYKRAIELVPNDYYPNFALGQAYAALRRHEDAILTLARAVELASVSGAASIDELIALYKTLGRAHFSRDRIQEATSAWGKIAEIDPENVFVRVELAELFREQELYAEAIEQHEAIIRLKEDDPYRVCLSYREIGKIHEEKGDYRNAIQSYDSAITMTTPGNWLRKDVQRRIIRVFASDGNWKGLIAYYLDKLQSTPRDSELDGLLASAYIENQQIDDGITAYRKALKLNPQATDLRLEFITVLKNIERFDEAAAEYEALREIQPDDLHIYRELGELYLQLEDENRAKSTYRRMIERDPENAKIHLSIADIYAGNEWTDDAIAAYERAVALAPDNLDYIQYYGEYFLRRDERDEALGIWGRMVAGDKAVPGNFDRFARLLWMHRFHTDAITASRKAVALAPSGYRYREALAQRLMENKQYDAALTEFDEASKLAPNEFFAEQMNDQRIEIFKHQGVLREQIKKVSAVPKTFNREKQLAKMHLKLGNATNAIESLIQAKILRPDDVPVNRQLGVLYEKQGLRNEAVAAYEHLAEIDAGNAREYCSKTARLQLQEGNFDAAIRSAKKVVVLNPRNPEGHKLLASIKRQQENYPEAIHNLKQAVRLNPDAIDLRAELAEVYKLTGENRLAIDQYWRCWDLCEDLNEKLSLVDEMSNVYDNLGTEGALKEKLRKLIRTHPADLAPAIALAEVYRKRGEFPGAVLVLKKMLQHQPENPILLSRIAKIYYESGDFEETIVYQQRLIKIQPDQAHRQRLAEFLFDAGR